MGIFTTGILGDIVGGLFGIVDDLHTSEEEKANIKLQIMEMASRGDLAQLEVNKTEAKHDSIFVAGWRPFIGWVCGTAFGWTFLFQPIVTTCAFYYFAYTGKQVDLSALPVLDLATMIPVLMGMLGLGGLRTYEKKAGVARSSITTEKKERERVISND